MNWLGHVAIVTGGASGIGEATAREFAIEGASIAILDINDIAGERVAAQLRAEGHQAVFHHLDVSNRDSCMRVVEAIVTEWGKVHYLVNSAVSFLTKGLDA